MPDSHDQQIGKYELLAELGQGGFGRVYRAFDPTVGRPVAIKVLSAEASRDVLTRFRNEATAAGNLRHKNVVTVYEFGEHNGRPFLVMELLEGQDLLQIIKDGRPLTLLQKMHIMDQVAEGLEYAHQHGVVHRDIKPANIRLLPDGTVKIMDFGIARVNRDQDETRLTQKGDLIGTILYMSPEQFSGGEADALCDIFAYGVTYYELLTGSHPFRSSDPARVMFKITMQDPEPVTKLVPECPAGLERVLMRALQKDRDLRYQSLRDLKLDAEPLVFDLEQERSKELVAQAREMADLGELPAGLALIEEALNLDARNTDARRLRDVVQRQLQIGPIVRQAEQLASEQLYSEALKVLQPALRKYVADPQLLELQERVRAQQQAEAIRKCLDEARRLLDAGQPGQALVTLNAALENWPGDPQIVELHLAATETRARRERESAVNRLSAEVAALAAQENFAEASKLAQSALRDYPAEPILEELEGRIQRDWAAHRQAEAARQRREAVQQAVQTTEAFLQQKDFAGALQHLEQVVRVCPGEDALTGLMHRVADERAAWQREQAIVQVLAFGRQLAAEERESEALDAIEAALREYGPIQELIDPQQQYSDALVKRKRQAGVANTVDQVQRSSAAGDFAGALAMIGKALKTWPGEPVLETLKRTTEDAQRLAERQSAIQQLAAQGEGLIAKRQYPEASKLVLSGLRNYAQEPIFLELEERIEREWEAQRQAEAARQRREAIDSVCDKAGQQLKAGSFAEALATLEAASKTWPGEAALDDLISEAKAAQAWAERQSAIQQLAAQGEGLLAKAQYAEASKLVQSGLRDYGQEPVFLGLEERIQRQWEAQRQAEAARQRREAIDSVCDKAGQQLKAGSFAEALATLEAASKTWPGEAALDDLISEAKAAQAWAERQSAIQQLAAQGEGLLAKAQYAEASKLVQSGLRDYGQEPVFLGLEERIQRQWEAQRQAEAARQRREAIDSVCDKAGQQLKAGSFAEALATLEAASKTWPGEAALDDLISEAKAAQALAERQSAIQQLAAQGEGLLAKAQYAEASKLVQSGLRDYGQEPVLLGLEERIQREWEAQRQVEAARQRREAIDSVWNKAGQQLKAGSFAEALATLEAASKTWPGEEALENLLTATKEAQALAERQSAIQQLAAQGEGLLAKAQYAEASKLVQSGLRDYGQEPVFLGLEERIQREWEAQRQVEAARQRREAIDSVCNKAGQQLKAGSFAEALAALEAASKTWPGEATLENLIRDAKAARALVERQSAIQQLAAQGEGLIAKGQFAEASKLVESAPRDYAQEPTFLELQERIQRKWEAQRQAEAARQRREAIDSVCKQAGQQLKGGSFAEALATLEAASKTWPGEATLENLIRDAKAARAARERQDAIDHACAQAHQKLNESDFTGALGIIAVALKTWPGEAALESLERSIQQAQARAEREREIQQLAERGKALVEAAQYPEALKLMQDGLRHYPREPVLEKLEAGVQRDWDAQRLAEAARLRREGVEQACARARQSQDRGDFAEALAVLEDASKTWPGEKTLVDLVNAAKEALARDQRQGEIRQLVAKCEGLLAQGRYAEAAKLLKAGLRQYPREPVLGELEGRIQRDGDAHRKAETASRRAAAVEEHAQEADRLLRQERYAEALKAVQSSLKKYPQEPLLVALQQHIREQSEAQKAVLAERTRRESVETVSLEAPQLASLAETASVLDRENVAPQAEAAAHTAIPDVAVHSAGPPRQFSKSPFALGAIAVTVLLIAGFGLFSFFGGVKEITVHIAATPAGTAVNVASKSCVMPNCDLKLAPGRYQIVAARAGYKSATQTLSLSSGDALTTISFALEPLPQEVRVDTNFKAGTVFLDNAAGVALRDGLFSMSGISPGDHTIRVEGEASTFSVNWRAAVAAPPELTSPISAQNLTATIVVNAGHVGGITSNSDLRGAKIDGKDLVFAKGPSGPGLLPKDLLEGTRQLSIPAGSRVIEVGPNPKLDIFLAAEQDTGTLLVETGQEDTRIYLNDRFYRRVIQKGILRIPVNAGTYAVRVEKDGFRSDPAQTMAVKKGDEKEIRFNLTPLPAMLQIRNAVSAAQVKVDGKQVGETDASGNLSIEVPAGDHTIELDKADYSSARFTTRFSPGKTLKPTGNNLTMAHVNTPLIPPPPDPRQIETQDWNRVRASTNINELDDFIRTHPGGSHLDEAKTRAAQLRQQRETAAARQAEQSAWDAVDKTNRTALQDFLTRHPNEAHAQDARGLLNDLAKQAADASAAAAQRAREQIAKEQQDPANGSAADQQIIQRVLLNYSQAYNSKNLGAMREVWRSMPKSTMDALRSEFNNAKTITFRLEPLGSAVINGQTATLPCSRSLIFVGRDGAKENHTDQVRILLTREGPGWVIQSILTN